ncbi:MAG TPA: PIN domain-containing protein [Terriglobales bacterium]|jgi:predicted nucleic acid-binding protein
MKSAVDTNVLVALWDKDDTLNTAALDAFERAQVLGGLVVPAPVYAELLALPGRTEAFLDRFFTDTGIYIDWEFDEQIWRSAGRAFQSYARRRFRQIRAGPRRILADFLIGAYALCRGYQLLTLDDHLYRAAFPELLLIRI